MPFQRYRSSASRLLPCLLAAAAANAIAEPSTAVAVRDAAVVLTEQSVSLPFSIGRDGDTSTAVSVRYTTVDGSAQAGDDYRPAAGIATIPVGQRSARIPVTVLGKPAGDREAGRFGLRLLGAFLVPAPIDQLALTSAGSATTAGHIGGMASGDFNSDGRPDLALANQDDGTLDILANTTAGGAAAVSLKPVARLSHVGTPNKPVVCDLNNDGRPDLAAATGDTNRASVYLNTTAPGSRSFSFERSDIDSLPFGWMAQLACADIDGDGRLDLAGANSGSVSAPGTNRLIVFRNTTAVGALTPSFDLPVAFAAHPANQKSMPQTIAAADFNGDGRTDVAIGHLNSADVTVLLNTTPPGAPDAAFAPPVATRTLEAPSDMAVLDADGDGQPDIATANGIGGQGGGTWALLMNRTPAGVQAPSFVPSVRFVGGVPFAIAVADMDLDGRTDVLITLLAGTDTSAGSVSVLLNRGEPGSNNPPFLFANTMPAGDEPHAVVAGDFNGDGLPDFVHADYRIGRQPVGTVMQSRAVQPLALRDPSAIGRLQ